MPAMAARRRSASFACRATSARIASVQPADSRKARAAAASCVSESAAPRAEASASRTEASASLSQAAASAARSRAAGGRGGPDFRFRVAGDEGCQLGRVGGELRHAQDALGGVGMLVKGSAGEEPGDHGGRECRCGSALGTMRQPE